MTSRAPVDLETWKATWGGRIEPGRLELVLKNSHPGQRVLDFGCGQGAYVFELLARGYEPIGVDREAYDSWGGMPAGDRNFFLRVDSPSIPFPDDHFDFALAFEVLEHCPDPSRHLTEIIRVTKRDVFLSVPDCDTSHKLRQYTLAFAHWTDPTHINFFTEEGIVSLVQALGLDLVFVGRVVEINLNKCYWNHVQLPKKVARIAERIMAPLVPRYFSSILIHARKA